MLFENLWVCFVDHQLKPLGISGQPLNQCWEMIEFSAGEMKQDANIFQLTKTILTKSEDPQLKNVLVKFVTLCLIPWDSTDINQPTSIDKTQLIELVSSWPITCNLEAMVTDKKISEQYKYGLPNKAHIIAKLSVAGTSISSFCVGGSSVSVSAAFPEASGGGNLFKRKKWDNEALALADEQFSRKIYEKELPDDLDTVEGFKRIIDTELPSLYTGCKEYDLSEYDTGDIISVIVDENQKPTAKWILYVNQMMEVPNIAKSPETELMMVDKFRLIFSTAWRYAFSNMRDVKFKDVANAAVAGYSTSYSERGHPQRMDHCFLFDEVLVLCAEHKPDASEQSQKTAIDDIIKKFHSDWNGLVMQGVPYIPAYTVCGSEMRFYLIIPDNGNKLQVMPVDTGYFDLYNVADRARIIRRAINLIFVFRILKLYSFRLATPKQVIKDSKDESLLCVNRPHCKIDFYVDRVEKVCSNALPPNALYEAVMSSYKNMDQNYKIIPDQTSKKVIYEPVYTQTLPLTWKQLANSLKNILLFLDKFHASGYVHRDIRWPNVLRTGSGKWVLIDFELSASAGACAPCINLIDKIYMPPEIKNASSLYNTAGDIWQVGRLIDDWKTKRLIHAWDGGIKSIYDQMIIDDPVARPNASTLLEALRAIV